MSAPEQLSVSELSIFSAPQEKALPMTQSTSTAQDPFTQQGTTYDIFDPLCIFTTITWLHIGPSKRVFGIHKGLLCYHSLYFRAALTGPFSATAAANNTLILADEDPETFSRFNCWIYAHKFDAKWTLEDLFDMYIFASKRLIRRFQNAIVDEMLIRVRKAEGVMSTSLLNRAWSDTPTLRPFLVDTVVETSDLDAFPEFDPELSSAVTRRSTDLWRQSQIVWPVDEAMHVARVVEPFGWVCERFHVHEREDEHCDLMVRHHPCC